MNDQELRFAKAMECFRDIVATLELAAREGWHMDQLERSVKPRLAEMGKEFLFAFAQGCGNGDVGAQVEIGGRHLQRSENPLPKRYASIFGELKIERYVYSAGEKQAIEYSPVDACLGLPAGDMSYVLEDYQQRLCVNSPYHKATDDLKEILGFGVGVRTAEHMNREMAQFAEGFRLSTAFDENADPAPTG